MDDDVFLDGAPREAEQKTPVSQDGDVSERSLLRVSPGAVRQEVSQAISDKKGMLIILKDLDEEDAIMDMNGKLPSKEGTLDESLMNHIHEESFIGTDDKMITLLSPKLEIETVPSDFRSLDSPKKAMAFWITEEVRSEDAVALTTRDTAAATRDEDAPTVTTSTERRAKEDGEEGVARTTEDGEDGVTRTTEDGEDGVARTTEDGEVGVARTTEDGEDGVTRTTEDGEDGVARTTEDGEVGVARTTEDGKDGVATETDDVVPKTDDEEREDKTDDGGTKTETTNGYTFEVQQEEEEEEEVTTGVKQIAATLAVVL